MSFPADSRRISLYDFLMILPDLKQQRLFLSLLACFLLAAGGSAWGQQAIPGSVDPSRVGPANQMPPSPSMSASPAPDAQPRQSGDIVIPGANDVLFTLVDLKITGMEAYPPGKFLGDYIGLLGKPVTLQQVIDIVNHINRTYSADGYIFSRAFFPEQDITAGVVTVQVVEGNIRNVVMEDVRAGEKEDLQPYLDRIVNVHPFNIKKFEHWLLVMNSLPGARFRSVLRQPDDKQPGAIEVVLFKEKTGGRGVAGIDNNGSLYAGPYQANLSYDQPRILDDYDQLSLRLSTTLPWDEVKYGQLGYEYPVAMIPGLSLNTHIGWGGTESGSNLRDLDIKGYSRDLRVGLTYEALLNRRSNLLFYLNFDMKNSRSKILGDRLYDDRLRVARASVAFQHIDDYDGSTLLTGEVSQGLDILGARESGSFELSRDDGRSDFTKVTAQVSRLQNLPKNFQVLTQLSGQYAVNPLLSAEEFGFGGAVSGRGLDPSEITGDHGLSATLELRYNGLLPWADFSFQPYAFMDFGQVWQKGDAPANSQSSLSTGMGTRIDYGQATSLNLLMAVPLTFPAGNPPKNANGESPRYLFSLSRKF